MVKWKCKWAKLSSPAIKQPPLIDTAADRQAAYRPCTKDYIPIDWSTTSLLEAHVKDQTKARDERPEAVIGAYEAKTRFSELIARAEKGESFIITKNGRTVARITPSVPFDRERAHRAVERLREFRAMQGPPVSQEEAQRNWEELKRELVAEDDERDTKWLSSSTPR